MTTDSFAEVQQATARLYEPMKPGEQFSEADLAGSWPQQDRKDAATVLNAAPSMLVEIERLRTALDKAAGRLGYLSTALSLSNKPNNAKGAWEWSEEARSALRGE